MMLMRAMIFAALVCGAMPACAALPPHVVTTTTHAQRTPAYSRTHTTHKTIYHR